MSCIHLSGDLISTALSGFAAEINPCPSDGCNVNWRDMVMLAGLAIAVAGCAEAILIGTAVEACAFAALGVALLFGAYYVRRYPTVESLQRDMRQHIVSLQAETTALSGEVSNLRLQNQTFETNNHQHEVNNQRSTDEINRLRTEIDDLHHVDTRLRETMNNLNQLRAQQQQENNRLAETGRKLGETQTSLDATARSLNELTNEVNRLKEVRQDFIDQTALLRTEITRLGAEKQQFLTLRNDMSELVKNIAKKDSERTISEVDLKNRMTSLVTIIETVLGQPNIVRSLSNLQLPLST